MSRRSFAIPLLAGLIEVVLVAGCTGATSSLSPTGLATGEGQSISDNVMHAWATGDQAAIEAVYASNVSMKVDGETLAKDRDGIVSVIRGAIAYGNTYRQVGPVIEYRSPEGDLYVTTTVEVTGPDHPSGDPVIGFYRVRDGHVIRHVFMDARLY